MQQVLIIGKVWPEPTSSAAGSRTLQLIELFQTRRWQVSFACAASESPYSENLDKLGVRKFNIHLNDSDFDAFIQSLCPDFVIFDRFTTEEQFGWRVSENCPGAVRVLDTIDLHCLREARHAALKAKKPFETKDLLTEIARREIACVYRSDLSLVISGYEMELLQDFFKIDRQLIHYLPFLLDPIAENKIVEWPDFNARVHFVSIGNFLHEPNWDAVLFLKNEIWPLIRLQLPKAELHVYGAYPSQKVYQLHDVKEGFLIKGRAEDTELVLRKARVLLAPLRFGAGMKGKLIDSMLYGTPNVTTPVGAEAMHDDLNWNGIIAKDPSGFALAAVKLYSDENIWRTAQLNGAAIINTLFSKLDHGEKLIEALQPLKKNLLDHRRHNFIGSMLQQQHFAATKYMSLWIEAKNKLKPKTD